MSAKIATLSLLILSLHLALVNVFAAKYSVGVSVGNWAKYEFTLDWISSSAQDKPPKAVEDAKNIDFIRVEVIEVFDTTVKIKEIVYFKNSSKKRSFYVGDVKTGQGNLSIQVIGANLGEGDNIFEDPESPKINATGPMTYAGATRIVNRLILETVSKDNRTLMDFYFDRETGFLCEMSVLSAIFTENYNSTTLIKWRIIETNLWLPSTSDNATFLWILFSTVAVGVIFYFVFKKQMSKKRSKSHRRFKSLPKTNKSNRLLNSLKGPLQLMQMQQKLLGVITHQGQ